MFPVFFVEGDGVEDFGWGDIEDLGDFFHGLFGDPAVVVLDEVEGLEEGALWFLVAGDVLVAEFFDHVGGQVGFIAGLDGCGAGVFGDPGHWESLWVRVCGS